MNLNNVAFLCRAWKDQNQWWLDRFDVKMFASKLFSQILILSHMASVMDGGIRDDMGPGLWLVIVPLIGWTLSNDVMTVDQDMPGGSGTSWGAMMLIVNINGLHKKIKDPEMEEQARDYDPTQVLRGSSANPWDHWS